MLKRSGLWFAGALLAISIVVAQVDNRSLGTWKLRSEKIVADASTPVPPLAANTVMTIKKNPSGKLALQIEPKQAWLAEEVVEFHAAFSPDGKTMTETLIGTGRRSYHGTRVWDKQ